MQQAYCQCESAQPERLFPLVPPYRLLRCRHCGLVWLAPQPDQQVLEEAYAAEYYTSVEAKFSAPLEAWTRYAARSRAARLLRRHGGRGGVLDILDIGCGRGALLAGFAARGHRVQGLERPGSGFETNPHVDAFAPSRLRDNNRRYAIIVLWHVLEHLRDPRSMLADVFSLLQDDGSLFIEVPNIASLQARLFGRRWFHLDPPRHLYHFVPETLVAILEEQGFRVERRSSFAFDQNLYGFVQSALNWLPGVPQNHLYSLLKSRGGPGPALQALLYLPLLLPLLSLAIVDLLLSLGSDKGAVISVHARKPPRAQS